MDTVDDGGEELAGDAGELPDGVPVLVEDEEARVKVGAETHVIAGDDAGEPVTDELAAAEELALGRVDKGVVVGDGVDGRVGVQVVRPEAEGEVAAELDVVDVDFEVDNAGREA